MYQWHGRTYLVSSLAWLRQLASKLGVMEQYNMVREQEMQTMIHNQENVNIENVSPGWANSPTFSPLATTCLTSSTRVVDLPVPGGPWITATSFCFVHHVTASL